MSVLGTLAVAIVGDLQGLEKAFGDIEKKADDFGKKMESAGKTVSNVGRGITSVGNTMTKYITAPVVGITAAVGGMVAAFGWGRLKAIDAAKAQLEGLGYAVEDVERISKHVSAAVQGTIMTMAEGTSVAAGALAAGVKEGAELEKYIKLVGSAALGANRPIDDMAQIFNRVQGGGRLMTRELNMIEQGMPGFAMAMSKHLGVSLEEFRKMVTGGKVSSREFLTVMEDFAGGMADAYADTWDGMVANTKANIGIIGENLLSGVFEQSKESIAEFLDLLRSDKAREWAKETGAKIAETFGKIIEKVKSLIEWWGGLSDGTKKAITTIAGIIVVAGPVLIYVGKLVTAVGSIITAFKAAGSVVSVAGSLIGLLTSPIGLVIAAIAALIAIGILVWKNWDTIKEKAIKIWGALKDFFGGVIDGIVKFFSELPGRIWEWLKDTYSKAKTWSDDMKKKAIEAGTNFLNSVIDFVKQLPGQLWNWLKETIVKILSWALDMDTKAREAGRKLLTGFIDVVKGLPGQLWNILLDCASKLLQIGGALWDNAKRVASNLWEGFKSGLGISSPSYIERALMAIGDQSKDLVSSMRGDFRSLADLPLPEMSYTLQGAGAYGGGTIGSREVHHTGTITVKGVNDSGQLSGVVDIVIERLLQEVRA